MSYSPIPLWAIQDTDGAPRVGAKVKFYQGGTSTPQAVYSDRSRSVSLGTTLTVDASGNVEMFYMLETTTYKVVITDSDDVVLYTFDDVVSPGSTGTGVTRTARATCPLDYGAVGDGVADEQSEVQSAIDDSTGDVDLAGKTYRCDSKLTLKSGVRIINGTINAANSSDTEVFSAAGSIGSALLLTSDGDAHDTSVEVSSGDAATLTAGDWVSIRSSETSGVGTSVVMGEYLRVQSVSGTTVSFTSALRADYAVANAASLRKLTPLTDIVLEDVNIISGNGVVGQSGVKVDKCEGVKLLRVTVVDVKGNHFNFLNSINSHLEKCVAENVAATINNVSYGVGGCARTNITGCVSDRNDIGISVGSSGDQVDSDLVVDSCNIRGSSAYGVLASPATRGLVIKNSKIYGKANSGATPVLVSGVNPVIAGNEIGFGATGIVVNPGKLRTYTTGALDVPSSKSDRNTCVVENNKISMMNLTGIDAYPDAGSLDIDMLRISGNEIFGCENSGISLSATTGLASYKNVDISDNTIVEAGAGIALVASGSETISQFTISNNRISGGGAANTVISLDAQATGGIVNGTVSGNVCQDGGHGIQLQNCDYVLCEGNKIKGTTLDGINYTVDVAGTYKNVRFCNNIVDQPGDSGIYILANTGNIEYFDIDGLQVRSPSEHAIHVQCASSRTATHLSLSNAHVSEPASGKNGVRIEGVSIADVSEVVISNCNVYKTTEAASYYLDSIGGLQFSMSKNTGNVSATDIAHAVHMKECRSAIISKLILSDIDGSGIYYENALGTTTSIVTIKDCDISSAELYGIDIEANDDLTYLRLKDNFIVLCLEDPVRIRAIGGGGVSTRSVSRVLVSGNYLHTYPGKDGLALVADDSATESGEITDCVVRDNVFIGTAVTTYQGMTLSGDGDYTDFSAHGNSFHGCTNAVELNCTGSVTRARLTSNQFFQSVTDDIVETNGTFEYKGEVLVADAGDDSLPNFV